MTMTITREICAYDEHQRSYHLRVELSERAEYWERGDNEKPAGVIEILSRIRGVQRVYLSGYVAEIKKGQAFTWEEVEPQILDILLQRFLFDSVSSSCYC